MKLDTKDLAILSAVREQSKTTSTIAKDVYPDSDKQLSNLDARVRSRLNRLKQYGLIQEESEHGPSQYSLKDEALKDQNDLPSGNLLRVTNQESTIYFTYENNNGQ